jgi:dTDP-4-amino-4,6-dideoxygalactose transaminase
MKVPFFSLSEQVGSLRDELLSGLAGVLDDQGFANGPAVGAFERELAEFLDVGHVVCVSSGTSALHGALLCAGVQPGDEVVTVAHTWISTVWAVSYVGATPVFVDVDAGGGLDPAQLRAAISERTRAILPVHLYGNPADVDAMRDVADDRGIPVIEDAAQSIGATLRGRQTGTLGTLGITSFYPSKNLGACGEGGAIFTDDDELADRARRLRDHAQASRHHHTEVGFNWRMDGFQGACLSVKLRHLPRWTARRREIAERYHEALAGVPGLALLPERDGGSCVWHVYPVFHARRDALRSALEERGVGTSIHYPTPVHLQPAYAHLGVGAGALPQSERMASQGASLPMYPEMTQADVETVIEAVRDACDSLAGDES